MSHRALCLVAQNENEALFGAANAWKLDLQEKGYETDIIRLPSPVIPDDIFQALMQGVYHFAFAPQGVGSALQAPTGGNLWSVTQTPFVALHFDHPAHNPMNHVTDSPFVGYLYPFPSFLQTRQKYLSIFPQIASVLHPLMPRPALPVVAPLKDRPIKYLFLKTGHSLQETDAIFNNLPPRLREGVFAQLDLMRKNPNLLVADCVDELFKHMGLDRFQFFNEFWDIVRAMDFRLRDERALAMVEWLKTQEGAVITGNGWDFVDKQGSKAVFKQAVPVSEVTALYASSQFVVNTNPYGPDVIHERMIWGLIMGACVISDSNAFWDQYTSALPNLMAFGWNDPIGAQIDKMMGEPARIDFAPFAAEKIIRILSLDQPNNIIAFVDQVRSFAHAQKNGVC